MVSQNASIYVVSHDDKLLESLPNNKYLLKVNLNRLGLDQALSGNQLAENRFLLTKILLEGNSKIVGFVSARWDERFPKWPSLGNLQSILTSSKFDDKSYLGPQTMLASGPQVKNWIKAQDFVHPGMSSLLFEVLECTGRNNLSDRALRPITMGNNFILERQTAAEFLEYWQKVFSYLHGKYGFELPFEYRCAKCGFTSPEGVGRWGSSRHAGFLYERVSALFFATNSNLSPLKPKGMDLEKVKRGYLPYLFRFGPKIYRAVFGVLFTFTTCKHTYTALGK